MTDYITVAELADWMGIDDSADDTLLQAAVSTSSRAIDAWCGRSFAADGTATARTYRAVHPWRVEIDDFHTVTGLEVRSDEADNGTYGLLWASSDVVCEPFNGYVDGVSGWPFCRLVAVGSRWFPCGARPRLQVTAKWGWAAVPAPIIEATYIKAARIFNRKHAPAAVGGFDTGTSGFSVPLIRVDVREDPDVVALCQPYVKSSSMFVAG